MNFIYDKRSKWYLTRTGWSDIRYYTHPDALPFTDNEVKMNPLKQGHKYIKLPSIMKES